MSFQWNRGLYLFIFSSQHSFPSILNFLPLSALFPPKDGMQSNLGEIEHFQTFLIKRPEVRRNFHFQIQESREAWKGRQEREIIRGLLKVQLFTVPHGKTLLVTQETFLNIRVAGWNIHPSVNPSIHTHTHTHTLAHTLIHKPDNEWVAYEGIVSAK